MILQRIAAQVICTMRGLLDGGHARVAGLRPQIVMRSRVATPRSGERVRRPARSGECLGGGEVEASQTVLEDLSSSCGHGAWNSDPR